MQRKDPVLRQPYCLLAYISCLLFLISPHLSAHAQNFKPQLTVEPGSAFIEGRGLYVVGGAAITGRLISQTFMIDLSVSWNSSSPACKSLPLGDSSNGFPSAVSADGQKWFVLVGGKARVLDFQSGNGWSEIFTYPSANGFYGLAATTDPKTGKVYIPFAYLNPDGSRGMMIVDLANNAFSTDNINSPLPAKALYAATWNSVLDGLLYVFKAEMYKYTPSTGWLNFNGPQGLVAEQEYCMVSSSSGSRVILFGGLSVSLNATAGDIFILDVQTLTWKKGPSTAVKDNRRSPACAVSNDYFIVWGGDTSARSVIPPSQLILVYNLKTDAWVSDYVAPAVIPTTMTRTTTPTTTPTITNAPSNNTSGSDNTGTIIGSIGGGVAAGLIVAGMYLYRARKTRSSPSSTPAPTDAIHTDTQPDNDKHPGDEMGEASRQIATVQPKPRHPQASAFESQPTTYHHVHPFESKPASLPLYGYASKPQPLAQYSGSHSFGSIPVLQQPHTVFVVNSHHTNGYE